MIGSLDDLYEKGMPSIPDFYDPFKKYNQLEQDHLMYKLLIDQGFSHEAALKKMKIEETPLNIEETYEKYKDLWDKADVKSAFDLGIFYLE